MGKIMYDNLVRTYGILFPGNLNILESLGKFKSAYGVVVSMFDFHRSDRGSNPGRGGKIS